MTDLTETPAAELDETVEADAPSASQLEEEGDIAADYIEELLDIGGSREARVAELGVLVGKAVERIEEGAESASLPPMSSYERKLVHDLVAEKGFHSESEGEGRDRHTVITR